jgi:hypothetical protein
MVAPARCRRALCGHSEYQRTRNIRARRRTTAIATINAIGESCGGGTTRCGPALFGVQGGLHFHAIHLLLSDTQIARRVGEREGGYHVVVRAATAPFLDSTVMDSRSQLSRVAAEFRARPKLVRANLDRRFVQCRPNDDTLRDEFQCAAVNEIDRPVDRTYNFTTDLNFAFRCELDAAATEVYGGALAAHGDSAASEFVLNSLPKRKSLAISSISVVGIGVARSRHRGS